MLFCWACKTGLFLLIYRPPASAPKVTCCFSAHTQLLKYHCSIISQQLPLLCWQNIQMWLQYFFFMYIFCISIHKLIFPPGLQEPWLFPHWRKLTNYSNDTCGIHIWLNTKAMPSSCWPSWRDASGRRITDEVWFRLDFIFPLLLCSGCCLRWTSYVGSERPADKTPICRCWWLLLLKDLELIGVMDMHMFLNITDECSHSSTRELSAIQCYKTVREATKLLV